MVRVVRGVRVVGVVGVVRGQGSSHQCGCAPAYMGVELKGPRFEWGPHVRQRGCCCVVWAPSRVRVRDVRAWVRAWATWCGEGGAAPGSSGAGSRAGVQAARAASSAAEGGSATALANPSRIHWEGVGG